MIINDKLQKNNPQSQPSHGPKADPQLQSAFEQHMAPATPLKKNQQPNSHNTDEKAFNRDKQAQHKKQTYSQLEEERMLSKRRNTFDKAENDNKAQEKNTEQKTDTADNQHLDKITHDKPPHNPNENKETIRTRDNNQDLTQNGLAENQELTPELESVQDPANVHLNDTELTPKQSILAQTQPQETIINRNSIQSDRAPSNAEKTHIKAQEQLALGKNAATQLTNSMAQSNDKPSQEALSELTDALEQYQEKTELASQPKTSPNLAAQNLAAQAPITNLGDRILEQLEKRSFDPEQLQTLLNKMIANVESLKHQGLSQSKMQLQLPQLGQMELLLHKTDNTLQVTILSHPGAQQLMQAARSELFERLQQELPDQELELSFGEGQPDSEQGSRNQRFIQDELEGDL